MRNDELEIEKSKLKDVIKLINTEMVNYIGKKKEVAEEIINLREKALEEYKDDEDKIAEYFDHERFVSEEAFKSIYRRMHELTILLPSPYFGRVDFKDLKYDEDERIYIGRFGIMSEDGYYPVVIDWRAPAASLFYNGGFGKSSYDAPRETIDVDVLLKRQFIIKKQELVGMFDSELNVKDEILQMVLSKNAGARLKDIVMTIQAEQDNLIRQPKYKTIIVDGAAGSGKTTIALHRVAYLLYNNRAVFQNKVLILGPDDIFMEYISNVLPSLGETGVSQQTFTDFACDILDVKVMNFNKYMERILSDDKKFIENMLYKTSDSYIDKLDNFILELDDSYFNIKDVKLEGTIVVSIDDIKDMAHNYYKDMPLFRRSGKIKRIIFSKLRDERDRIRWKIEEEYKKKVSELTEEQLNVEGTNLRFARRLRIRELIKNVMDVKKQMSWIENGSVVDLYKNINGENELTIDDLAPLLYLKIKLEGFKLKNEIKHVVIDEAQDYSKLQFIVIKEITRCSGFTIVGDSNQRMLPLKGKLPMLSLDSVFSGIDMEYFKLSKSYRSTKEIMNYANKFIKNVNIEPMLRSGNDVNVEKPENEHDLIDGILGKISEFQKKQYETIAIICKNADSANKIGSLLKNIEYVKLIDTEDISYKGGIIVIPSYFAKGMEFDAVIIAADNINDGENKLMYVMATRALHELCVYETSGI